MSRVTDLRTKLLSLVLVGLMVLSVFAGPTSAALATSEATSVSTVGGVASSGVDPADIRGTVTDGPVEPSQVDDGEKINTSDNVSIWQLGLLTLRPDDKYTQETVGFYPELGNSIKNTEVLVSSEELGVTGFPLDKGTLFVYNQSEEIDVGFSPGDLGRGDDVSGEDLQLVKVYLSEDASQPDSPEDIGGYITSNENTTATIVDNVTGESSTTYSFTPERSGQYVFAVVLAEDGGEGLAPAETEGNLEVRSNITIVGFDYFPVQSGSSNVQSPDIAAAGNTIEADASATSLDTDNISHTTILVNESVIGEQTQEIEITGGELSNITSSIERIEGSGDLEGGTNLLGNELPSSEYKGNTDIISLLEGLAGESSNVTRADSTAVIYASVNSTTGGPQETIRLETTENFSSGDYQIIHFATAQEGTETVTTKNTILIQDGTQLNLTASAVEIRQGESVTLTVTADGSPVENANITYNGQTVTTNSTGQVTLTPQESGTATVTKDPANGETFVSDSVDLFVQTPEFEVTNVNFSAIELTTEDTLVVNAAVQEVNGISGDFTFELIQNDTVVDNTTVAVDAEGTATTSFEQTFEQADDYAISVNGVNETVVTVTGFPNITYSDLTVSQSGDLNETVTVSATVSNEGQGPGEYRAPLIRNGTTLANQTGTLDPGESDTVSFTRTLTSGTYRITIKGLPAETITVDQPKGISYSNFEVDPLDAAFGDTVTANVTVTSDADRTANVSLVVNGNQTQFQEIGLNASESEDVSFEIDTRDLGLGDSTVTIVGVPTEETVTVTAADLTAQITNTPTNVRSGVVPVEATVSNLGNAEASDARVVLEGRPDGGTYSELVNESVTVGPGGSTTVAANLTRDEARNYTVRVRSDAADQFLESNETNNNDTQAITGGPLVVGTVNNSDGTPAANDVIIRYTIIDGNLTNPTFTEIREDGRFLAPVNATETQVIGYGQSGIEESRSNNVSFPRDGSPDIYALARFDSVPGVSSIGGLTLPSAGVLNITVVDQQGNPVEDARVSIVHRNNDSRVRFNANTTSEGTLATGDDGQDGIELNGTTNVTVRPPSDAGAFADREFRRNVTVDDDGEEIEVQLVEGPDLTATLDLDRTQRLTDNLTADVTVSNNGLQSVDNATVALRVRKSANNNKRTTLTKRTGALATREDGANNSTTFEFDFTQFAENNLLGDRADGNARVTAVVDPDGNIDETNEGNNQAVNRTSVRYVDPSVQVLAPDTTITSRNTPVTVLVKNNGTATLNDTTVDLEYGDGTNDTVSLGNLTPTEANTTAANHTYGAADDYTITANASDAVPFENNGSRDITVKEFELTLDDSNVTVPRQVTNGTTFTVTAEFDTNFSTTVNTSINLPDGLELTGSQNAKKQITSTADGGTATFTLRANTTTGDLDNRALNVTVDAFDKQDVGNASTNVSVPKLRLTASNSTQLQAATTVNRTINVSGVQTFAHSVNVTVQGGTEGRTLQGLEYLFFYPYGCVEQTTSQMTAALRTDQYYRSGDEGIPDNYDRDRANSTIAGGITKLSDNQDDEFYYDLAQNEDGSYSMYGGVFFSEGDPYYTTVALQGISAVANDEVQGSRSDVATDIATINRNKTVVYLSGIQEDDGSFATNSYFLEERNSATGYTMLTIESARPALNASAESTANDSLVAGAEYLIENQNADGSWDGDDANSQSTALAIRGLAVVNESAELRERVNENTTKNVSEAIDDGTGWLVENQNDDGSWDPYRDYYWFSSLGEQTRATGHAMLALNEAKGLGVGNATVGNASSYLVGVYSDDGSFGNTRATGVAIDALTTVGQRDAGQQTVNVTIQGTTKTVEVNASTVTATASFNKSELRPFRDAGTGEIEIETQNNSRVVVGIDSVQVVDADEFEEDNN